MSEGSCYVFLKKIVMQNQNTNDENSSRSTENSAHQPTCADQAGAPAAQQPSETRPAAPKPSEGGSSPALAPTCESALLDELASLLAKFVILPQFGADTLALWVVHTYAFHLRDVTTYLGIESPEKRCGKTTLLAILSELVHRPVVASNISPSAFFRVIQEMQPTLLIDEADTFLQGNDELRGILNAGYSRKTAYVMRVTNETSRKRNQKAHTKTNSHRSLKEENQEMMDAETQDEATTRSRIQDQASSLPSIASATEGIQTPHQSNTPPLQFSVRPPQHSITRWPTAKSSRLVSYSCWCPKVMAAIGRLPDTLADRCVVLKMQRKLAAEKCERLRNLDTAALSERCERFVKDNETDIANMHPKIPEALNDRAADVWEPLFALADIAGHDWPERARTAALGLTANGMESNPFTTFLQDIAGVFVLTKKDKLFTRELVQMLETAATDRPWRELTKGARSTEMFVAHQLRRYGIRPKTLRIDDQVGRGYLLDDFREIYRRYVPRS
jgi:hypothetical protein